MSVTDWFRQMDAVLYQYHRQQLLVQFDHIGKHRQRISDEIQNIKDAIVEKYTNVMLVKDTYNKNIRQKFIKHLLKKIEIYQLYSNADQNKTHDSQKAIFEWLLKDINSINANKENLASLIENKIIVATNQKTIVYLREQLLFASHITNNQQAGIKISQELNNKIIKFETVLANNVAKSEQVVEQWLSLFKQFINEINKYDVIEINADWVKAFVDKHCLILETIIINSDEHQNQLHDIMQSLLAIIDKIDNGNNHKQISHLGQLLNVVKYALYKHNSYLYTDETIRSFDKKNPQHIDQQQWQSLQDNVIERVSILFEEIKLCSDDDITCTKLVNELRGQFSDKSLYNSSQVKQKVENVLNKTSQHIRVFDSHKVLDEDLKNLHQLTTEKRILKLLNIFQKILAQSPHDDVMAQKVLIKLYLNVRDLTQDHCKNLDVKLFIERVLKLIKDKNHLVTPHISMLNKVMVHLTSIYKQAVNANVDKYNDINNMLKHIESVGVINNAPHIQLASYLNVFNQMLNKQNEPSIFTQDTLNNLGITILNSGLTLKVPITPLNFSQLFKEVVNANFNNKEGDNKVALTQSLIVYIATLPLLSLEILNENDCQLLISQLVSNTTITKISDMSQFIQLIQVLLKHYFSTVVLPKYKLDDDRATASQVLGRLLVTIDNISERLINAVQLKDENIQTTELVICFSELKGIANSLLNIGNPSVKELLPTLLSNWSKDINNQDYEALVLNRLLMPREIVIAKRLSFNNVKAIITDHLSNEWYDQIVECYKEKYTRVVEKKVNTVQLSEFKSIFGIAFNHADDIDQLSDWLQCVDILEAKYLQNMNFIQIQDILNYAKEVDNYLRISQLLNQSSPELIASECLFDRLLFSLEQVTQPGESRDALFLEFQQMKEMFYNCGDVGLAYLRTLSDVLVQHKKNCPGHFLEVSLMQDLLKLSVETKAYNKLHVVDDLKDKSIKACLTELMREKLALSIDGYDKNEQENIKLVDHLQRLMKHKNPELVWILLRHVKSASGEKGFPLTILRYIVNEFASNRWMFEPAVLDSLYIDNKVVPAYQWIDKLNEYYEKTKAERLKIRDPKKLMECMREDINGINTPVKDLITPNQDTGLSELEQRLKAIDLLFNSTIPSNSKTINEWNEGDVLSWAHEFKKNGENHFRSKDKVNEFMAVIMRAVELSKQKGFLPRDTQRIALLCFIESFQTGKGRLADISTGEGKSIITIMLAIARVLRGEKVDIITSSKVLAERDAAASEKLFGILGIKVSNNCDVICENNEVERKNRYQNCDVIYGETGYFQRDLLLTKFFGKDIRQQQGNSLIVDEVDSMFIDNAERTLYISHNIDDLKSLKDLFILIWASVHSPDKSYETAENKLAIQEFIAEQIKTKAIYVPNTLKEFIDRRLAIWIDSAYQAKHMQAGNQYVIGEQGEKVGKAIVMDLDTGVEQVTTQWSNGLHQFVQLKNFEKFIEESLKAVFMANVSFFQSYRGHINGMSGTLGSEKERELMAKLYDLDYFQLPRYREERYIQEEAIVVGTKEEWLSKIEQVVDNKMQNQYQLIDEHKQKVRKELKLIEDTLSHLINDKKTLEDKVKNRQNEHKQKEKQLSEIITAIKQDDEKVLNDKNNTSVKTDIKEKVKATTKREQLVKTRANLESAIVVLHNEINSINLKIKSISEEIENNKVSRDIVTKTADKMSRALLLICENKNSVDLIAEKIRGRYAHSKNIRTYDSALKKFEMHKLGPDDIIAATNISGRGADFETTQQLENNGGLCVPLTYVSPNGRVDKQAFRRTARQGNSGSGLYIVWDPRAVNKPITIDFLCDERDEREQQRLEHIYSKGIPKILMEEKLFQKFIIFQQKIKKILEDGAVMSSEHERKIVQLQLKSLQNKWAYFLDGLSERIDNIVQHGEANILNEYNKFEESILHLLESSQFKLINEPSELMKLGKCYFDEKVYRKAEDCYDAIIEKEPDFGGFAHYYKAACIFGQGSDLNAKRRAKSALKRAVSLLESKLSRLATCNQAIQFIGQRQQNFGLGTGPDQFTKSNLNEMSVIQIHINAAKEALGTELSEDTFKSGVVTGEEHKTIFENLRKNFKERVIQLPAVVGHANKDAQQIKTRMLKDYRVSKKLSYDSKNNQLFWNKNKIELPGDFAFCKEKLVKMLVDKIKPELSERELVPEAFNSWMLTKNDFLQKVDKLLEKQNVIQLHENVNVNAMGLTMWNDAVFQNKGEIVKNYILSISKALSEKEFNEELAKLTGLSTDKISAIQGYLKSDSVKIIKIADSFNLVSDANDKIKNYLEKVMIKTQNPHEDFEKLGLKEFPRLFKHNEIVIKNVLKEIVQGKIKNGVTKELLKCDDEQFRMLSVLLQSQGFIDKPLVAVLGLENKFDVSHYAEVEEQLLKFYEMKFFKNDDISLCDNAFEKSRLLWAKLKSMQIVKDPKVNFALTDQDVSNKVDFIKEQIKSGIDSLIGGKSSEDKEKYADSIFEALEKAIGKIKSINKLKLSPQTLQDYYRQGKMPPEVADFIRECCDEVLQLKEDKGWWDWDAFLCAMIGVLQIVVGVVINVFSLGSLSFLGNALISEGIGDIIFAVQNGINGTFSWKAYGDYKWQSLLISITTAGIGAIASRGAQTAKIGIDATKAAVANAVAKEFLSKCAQAAISTLVTVGAEKLAQEATQAIFTEVKSHFRGWVENDAGYQLKNRELNATYERIYKKFGATEADRIITQVMADTQKSIRADMVSKIAGKLTQVLQSLSGNLAAAADKLGKSGGVMGNIANVVSQVVKVGNYINRFREIASMTPRFVGELNDALKRAELKEASASASRDNSPQLITEFCNKHLKAQTDIILAEMQNFINQNLTQSGLQSLIQLSVQPISNAITQQLSVDLEELQKEGNLKENGKSLLDRLAAAADDYPETSDTENNNRSPASEDAPVNLQDHKHNKSHNAHDKKGGHHDKAHRHSSKNHPTNKHSANNVSGISASQNTQSDNWSLLNDAKEELLSGPFCSNDSFSLMREDQYRRLEGDLPIEQSFDLFDVVGAGQLAYGVAKIAPTLINRGGKLFMNGAVSHLGKVGFFRNAASSASANISELELLMDEAARSARPVNANTFFGKNIRHMRNEAQKIISKDPNHPLKFFLNDKGKFHPTRGVSHAELLDNPHLVQMGHVVSKSSGAPEKIMLQGAWENQFNAITIEKSTIGGFVKSPVVDIGGIAIDLRTIQSWKISK